MSELWMEAHMLIVCLHAGHCIIMGHWVLSGLLLTYLQGGVVCAISHSAVVTSFRVRQ